MRQVSCLVSQKRVDPVKFFRKRHGNDPVEWCGMFGIRLEALTHPRFTRAIHDRFDFRNHIRDMLYASSPAEMKCGIQSWSSRMKGRKRSMIARIIKTGNSPVVPNQCAEMVFDAFG